MRRPIVALAALGLATTALTWAAIGASAGWPATLPQHLPHHLALYVGAGAAWAASLAALRRLPDGRGQLPLILVVAVALRVPAWLHAPAHSDDVHRYLWDGRVQQAGINPYLYPPDAPELSSLRDDNWAQVNNRQLPTIYPPLAQLAFRAAAALPLPPSVAWKLLAALADLSALALLVAWLRRRRGDVRAALAWGWSPLVVVELGQNAHVDGLGIALLVAALAALEAGRRGWAGALVGASAAVKLLAVGLLPSLRGRRARAAFALALVICALPYAGAGAHLAGSLGEYGRRWRGNDGAFALVQEGAERAVAHTRFAGRYDLGASPRLARAITGRDRDTVFPDEVASLIARVATLLVFALAVGVALAARVGPVRLATVVLGGFLLLTPTLHPWYVLWVVPLIAVGASAAWVALAALAPLGYQPLGLFLAGGGWHDAVWTRAVEHGLTWSVLAGSAWKALTERNRPLLSGILPKRDPP